MSVSGSGTTDGLFCINTPFIVSLKNEQRLQDSLEREKCVAMVQPEKWGKKEEEFYLYKCLSSGKENVFAKLVSFLTSPLFELLSTGLGEIVNGPLSTSPVIHPVCLLAGAIQHHSRY